MPPPTPNDRRGEGVECRFAAHRRLLDQHPHCRTDEQDRKPDGQRPHAHSRFDPQAQEQAGHCGNADQQRVAPIDVPQLRVGDDPDGRREDDRRKRCGRCHLGVIGKEQHQQRDHHGSTADTEQG
jgi:hypothetical protein